MSTNEERRSLMKALEEAPHDRSLRLVYADWLDEHNEPGEAILQRCYGELLHVAGERQTLFARPGDLVESGPAWERLTDDRQTSLKSEIGNLFAMRPRLQFVVVSAFLPIECELHLLEGSPIAHWHLENDQVQSVVPDALPRESEAALIEAARCLDAETEANRAAVAIRKKDDSWGENSEPVWDLG